jgi:hypothetical protein
VNGTTDMKQAALEKGIVKGVVNKRSWTSRVGHRIVMDDTDGKESIELKTGDNNLWVKLDQQAGLMTIDVGGGQSKLTMDKKGNVMIETSRSISFKAAKDIELSAMNIKIEAQKELDLKSGMNVTVAAQAKLTAKGAAGAKIEGVTVQIAGQALTEVKGALVKIN